MHAKLTSTQDMISTASSFVVAEYVFNRGVDGKVSNETRVSLFGKRHFILFLTLPILAPTSTKRSIAFTSPIKSNARAVSPTVIVTDPLNP